MICPKCGRSWKYLHSCPEDPPVENHVEDPPEPESEAKPKTLVDKIMDDMKRDQARKRG